MAESYSIFNEWKVEKVQIVLRYDIIVCIVVGLFRRKMKSEVIEIQSENDIYLALSAVRKAMEQLNFSELEKQKVFVSVSELARNILTHAHGKGVLQCETVREGIWLTVTDQGPGIPRIREILQGERVYSKTGLGLGLNGVQRLMDEFYVETGQGGTKIIAVKWKESKR